MGWTVFFTVLAFAAYLLALRRRLDSLADALLAALVCTTAHVVVLEIVLAAFGLLRPVPLAAANLLLSAAVFGLSARSGLRETLRAIVRPVVGFWRGLRRSPLSLFLVVLLVILAAGMLWLVGVYPEHSYDPISYRLIVAFSRLSYGDMRFLVGDPPPWISVYPEYAELLMVWTAFFDRVPSWTDGIQWPFWLAGVLAVYALARKLGCSPPAALQGSALLAFAPAVLLQSRTGYNDLLLAVLFLSGLNFLAARSTLAHLVAGLALGLAAGIKYNGLFLALFAGLALLLVQGRKLWAGQRAAWLRLLAYVLPVLALGLPWYVANWVHFGNPVYPFAVQIGGQTLFPGLFGVGEMLTPGLTPALQNWPRGLLKLFFWLEPTALYTYDALDGGLGPLWVVLGVPAVVYLLLTGWRDRRPAWVVALVGMGGLCLAQPNIWVPRYSLFLLGLGGLAVAWVLHRAAPWTRRLVQVLLVVGVLWTVWTVGPLELTAPSQVEAYACMPATLRPFTTVADAPAYRWLEGNIPSGSAIVYGYGLDFGAPLWANDLEHRVFHVDMTAPEQWLPEVVRQGGRVVFVGRVPAMAWLEQEEGLARVYVDDCFVIYRVR
jgi:hypothetical protein